MKYTRVIASGILVSTAFAAYVPSEPWSTLTPTASAPSGATTDYSNKFGIQIKTLSSASATSGVSNEKRDAVNQIEDGQIQKQNSTISTPAKVTSAATVINQIDDGQIQHQTASVINQIDDGQIQHQTASVINQIDDGQIQHQTASVINQIDDGQIQHQTAATTASAINQIDDGQIQHQTATASGIDQITDGQIQHQTATAASQILDGQVQNPTATASSDDKEDSGDLPEACIGKTSLSMTLKDSILTDASGRVGAIVANRQFQFDGPPPQAGSIYAAGWSITSDGLLALGDQTTFYQCKSGDFYNLYDENTAEQCSAVELEVIKFVDC